MQNQITTLAGDARQPLFSVIPSRSIHLRLSADFCRHKAARAKRRLTIAYGQTAGVCNIFPSALCGCH